MYGWIQQCIESLVLEKFGAETWAKIKLEAGCDEIPMDGWVRHESYDDKLTLLLVGGASKVLGIPADAVLTVFGEYFIVWLVQQGYKGFLQSFGSDLCTFLQNMNRMHANLKLGMPEFVPPVIACRAEPSPEDCEYLLLEYTSCRKGLAPMMIGIIKGCAEQLFDSSYECNLETSRVDRADDTEVEVHIYRITYVKGRRLCRVGENARDELRQAARKSEPIQEESKQGQPQRKKPKPNYNFFQHNPNMAQGWVETVVDDVNLLTEYSMQDFAAGFDLQMIISLIKSFNPYALKGLTGLFRKPLCNQTVSMPVPSLGYVPETKGKRYMECRPYPSIAMTANVTFGHNCLVRVKGTRGYHQEPLEVFACAVPNLHTSVSMLKAFVETPNEEILACPATSAILTSAWRQVLPRYLADLAIDVILVMLLTVWITKPSHGYLCWQYLLVVGFKELLEEVVQMKAYYERGWLVGYWDLLNVLDWCRILLTVVVVISVFVQPASLESADTAARYPLGVYACHRWWRILFHLRGFESMGPKLLPIMYAVMSLGPFTVVLLVVMLGFAYLLAALETFTNPTAELYTSLFQAAFLPEILEVDTHSWATIWLYIVVVIVGVVLVNILIGVLGESYDIHQDNHQVIFNRERANLSMKLSMCMWPRKVTWTKRSRYLEFLMNIVSIECPERAGGDDSAYLWFCMTRSGLSQASRLRNMKDHVSAQTVELSKKIGGDIGEVHQKIADLHRRFDNLEMRKDLCPGCRIDETIGCQTYYA